MRKLIIMIVLSFGFSSLVQAQNSFSFSIVGPGYSLSANNYQYYPFGYQLGYPLGYYYPPMGQQIIVPTVPYLRQPVLIPMTVCDSNIYTMRDQFGNLLTSRNCWTEMRWQ